MRRFVIVARLAPGTRDQVLELLRSGPPFDPKLTRLRRHAVYLSDAEVVFQFEDHDAEWEVDDLVGDIFHPEVTDALERWRPLLDGRPRIASEAYFWERQPAPP
jgi:hypothetical protein